MKQVGGRQDLAAGILGAVALVLAIGALLALLRPESAPLGDNTALLAFGGLVVGVVGLYAGPTRGRGRQVAVIGTGLALLAVALFGGSVAFDALLERSGA